MTRVTLAASLLVAGTLSMAASGYQRPPATIAPILRVADNLYFIGGSDPQGSQPFTGGSTSVFVTASGVVVVDTKNPGFGEGILGQVRSITGKPVTMIINTHTHRDHTGGNTSFPAAVEVVAHENTKRNMSKATCTPMTNCTAFQGENAKYLPRRTFKDTMSLLSGKDAIDLYYFGPGHTDGDAWVVFRSARAMHVDMFARKGLPFIDVDNGGSALGYGESIARAVATLKNVDTIIPGHSDPLQWRDLTEFSEYYRELVEFVRRGLKSGMTVDAVADSYKIPERYKGYTLDKQRLKDAVTILFAELSK